MNEKQLPRNRVTHQAHRKESLWQIWLPLALGVLTVLGFAIWSVIAASNGGNISQAADASLIIVLTPVMLMSILLLALMVAMVYLLARVLKFLPPKMLLVQYFFMRVETGTRRASNKLAEPSLRVGSFSAALRAFRSAFARREDS